MAKVARVGCIVLTLFCAGIVDAQPTAPKTAPKIFRRYMIFSNKTSQSLTMLTVLAPDGSGWVGNIMNTGVRVPPNSSLFISIRDDAPCIATWKAHFANGRDMIDRNINSCKTHYLEYNEFI